MKKIWTMVLALVGISSNAYADCYDIAIETFDSDATESTVSYCVQSDLRELESMRENYNTASTDEKYLMSLRALQMADRLEDMGHGDVVMAAAVCAICHGGGSNPR